jgi:hypothetical protein
MTNEHQRYRFAKTFLLIATAAASGIILCCAMILSPSDDRPREALRPFTSDGHVLNFGTKTVVVAAADHTMRLEFAGGRSVAPVVKEKTGGSGGDSTAAPELDMVTYPGVWDGVTAVFERRRGAVMESSYLVRGGRRGNPAANIRLSYNRPVRVNGAGELVIAFANGELRESAPVAWQEKNGRKTSVRVAFRLIGEREVGFEVGAYDSGADLVIDPTMIWNAFLGGSGWDVGRGIAVDRRGNIYVSGYSDTTWGSPARGISSGFDAFVSKLDDQGNLIWNTFLGGVGADYGYGVAVDGNGNVFVTGYCDATWGSPKIAFAGKRDAFAAKLDSDGHLLWNTFLGGAGNDYAYGVAVDGSGNAYVAGSSTDPWGSPVTAFADVNDAFAAKLDGDGNLVWSTFLGGAGDDFAYGIAADAAGDTFITGTCTETWGVPINPRSGGYDAFVAKLDVNGSLVWNTFAGENGWDVGTGITVDGDGNIYFAGTSNATWGTPVSDYTASYDAFAAKLDADGNLVWNTFLGGNGTEYARGIALDGTGNPYIVGYSDYPWGSPLSAFSYVNEIFIAKLDGNGNLAWNMFLGGAGNDFGEAIATDGQGYVYISGTSDNSWGSPGIAYASKYDAFVAKIPVTPTLITLSSFTATAQDGDNLLSWTTTAEQGTTGFHVWRKGPADTDYLRLTASLIPAQGDASTGASYEFLDTDAVAGESYLYKLENIDIAGLNGFDGPISIVAGMIHLSAPADGLLTGTKTPAEFIWQGGVFTSFKLEFSKKSDFSTTILTLPSSGAWLAAGRYTPTAAEWEAVRKVGAFAGMGGSVYWRVRGTTSKGNETLSEVRYLVILLGR